MSHSYVLVVDDDNDIRESVAEALADCGYEVLQAENGVEALTRMRADPPCIVLLDLMMPVMDGWEVVREMAADVQLKEVPVCIVSALGRDRAPPRVTSVMQKPAKLDALVTTIEEHCSSLQV